jgi:hypothetical protein
MRDALVSTNQSGRQQRARATLGSRNLARTRGLAALSATVVLTACGGGGGGGVATVTATTNIAVTTSPRRTGVTTSEPRQFAATLTNTTSSAVSWSVDGIPGGSALVGTMTSDGLYVPPSAAGTHTVTATSAVDPSKSGSSTVAVTDLAGVYTRNNDVARTGQNLQEYALTPDVVGGNGNFGKLFQCSVDETTYAQPLYVANLPIANGVHNVIFVATEHDSVYAFDADALSCVMYWHVSFLNGATVTTVSPSIAYQSTVAAVQDLVTEIGITGTPVISATESTLYGVAKTQETDASNNVTYAYYNGTVYIGMTANPVIALPLTNGLFSASGGVAIASSASTEIYQYPGPTPMISASPAGNGIVWVLDASANGTSSDGPYAAPGPAILRAYNATNLATTLYSSSALAGDVAGNAVKFMAPVIANGKVYVGGDQALTVYGLLP